MLRQGIKARAALALVAALAVIAVVVVVLSSGSGSPARPAAAAPTRTVAAVTPTPAASLAYGPPPLARYKEAAPHVASTLSVYGVQGQVTGAPATPPDELSPVSPSSFRAPVAAYRSYSVARLALMQGEIAKLETALAANDRGAAQAAWRGAYAYYLNLGAVYLEGPIADLNDAIDGTPGGVPGGVSSSQFSGLHRIERGLWTGAPLASLGAVGAHAVGAMSRSWQRWCRTVQIDPLDYATRAHEILEDAVRDQLSGTDAPWSGAGVLGTSAGVVATTEVLKTLTPILQYREGILPIVNADMGTLRTTLAAIQRAHGGHHPDHLAAHPGRDRATRRVAGAGAGGPLPGAGCPGDHPRSGRAQDPCRRHQDRPMKPLNRRSFLARGALATGAAGAALATGARAADLPDTPTGPPTTPGGAVAGSDLSAMLPFTGVHQSGILNPAPAHATLVAFDSMAPDARTLGQALEALSSRARALSAGGPVPLLEVDAPPADSGTLGPDNTPDALTVTISFGASLFERTLRAGLQASRRS